MNRFLYPEGGGRHACRNTHVHIKKTLALIPTKRKTSNVIKHNLNSP